MGRRSRRTDYWRRALRGTPTSRTARPFGKRQAEGVADRYPQARHLLNLVEIHDATVVPAGKIGLLPAMDGSPLLENESIAKSVDVHDDYQDGMKILTGDG